MPVKQLFFFTVMAITLTSVCFAQKEQKKDQKPSPPAGARAAFAKAFPGSSNVKWSKEDLNFEAEFKQYGKTMSAEFDAKGALLETEVTIKTEELPAPAVQYVKDHYKGARIKEAAKLTKPSGEVNYEAEVNKTDLVFDANGKFLKLAKD